MNIFPILPSFLPSMLLPSIGHGCCCFTCRISSSLKHQQQWATDGRSMEGRKEGWKNGKDVYRNRLYLTFKPIVSSISFILYFFTLKNSGSCCLSPSPSFSLFLLLAQEPLLYLMLSYFTYFPKIVFFLHILYQIVKLKKSITIPFFFSFVNTLL